MKIAWRLQDPRREAIDIQFIVTMYGVHAAGQITPLSYNHVLPHMILFPEGSFNTWRGNVYSDFSEVNHLTRIQLAIVRTHARGQEGMGE